MKSLQYFALLLIILHPSLLLITGAELEQNDKHAFQLKKFEISKSPFAMSQEVSPRGYIEASGRRATILGTEDGVLECWIYPFKILRNLRLHILLDGRSLELLAEDLAVHIEVNPETTIITYSHPQFTIREILFAPLESQSLIILFDIDTHIPLTLGVKFLPEFKPMWPGSLGGQYARWAKDMKAFLISESRKKYAAYVGSPLASRYFYAPAHRLADAPNCFEIDISPEYAQQNYIPIIIAGGPQNWKLAAETYNKTLNSIQQLYKQTQQYYSNLLENFLSIECPNEALNLAFQWGKIALNKGFVTNPYLGSGLIAGYGLSGRSERPGFCWFFGGDAFINSFAMNGYGDFEIIKSTLRLFQKYQREDGKIMHEMSQSASMIPWFNEYPYAFYHADTTPYFIMAMHSYIIASGDLDFLNESWNSVKKTYKYCLSTDADGNGLMENSQAGLGAVETGALLRKIKEDIYLAGIWTESLRCLAEMAKFANENTMAVEAEKRYHRAQESINKLFWNEEKGFYSFALTEDGGRINEVTIWPTIPIIFGLLPAERAEEMLKLIASEEMSTDWGVRMLSKKSKLYDPISYNNGSVWPFLTGFASLAEYTGHRALPAFEHLKQNASLTFEGSQGYITELLSGDYFRPLDSSVPHQLFSSSTWMFAFMRGLLGLKANAINHTLSLSPHLPSHWKEAKVKNFRIGQDIFDLQLHKERDFYQLKIENKTNSPSIFSLLFNPALPQGSIIRRASLNGKDIAFSKEITRHYVHPLIRCSFEKHISISIDYKPGFEIELPQQDTKLGDSTKALKYISSRLENDTFSLILEGQKDKNYHVKMHIPWKDFTIKGAEIVKTNDYFTVLTVSFLIDKKKEYIRQIIEITKKPS